MKLKEITKDKKNVAIIALCAILVVSFMGSLGAMSETRYAGGYAEGVYANQVGMPSLLPSASKTSVQTSGSQMDLLTTEGRKIIQNANLDLEVSDVDQTFYSIKGISAEFDGFIADSYIYESYGTKSGYVVLRVPKANFNAALERAKMFGTVKNERVTSDDITEQYTDLSARLNSLKASENRMLVLLDRAENVSQILEIEKELANLRERIESLEGSIRYLDSRMEMSTITVNIREPQGITAQFNLNEVLSNSANGFIGSTIFIIEFIGGILPFVLVVGTGWVLYNKAKKMKQHAK